MQSGAGRAPCLHVREKDVLPLKACLNEPWPTALTAARRPRGLKLERLTGANGAVRSQAGNIISTLSMSAAPGISHWAPAPPQRCVGLGEGASSPAPFLSCRLLMLL